MLGFYPASVNCMQCASQSRYGTAALTAEHGPAALTRCMLHASILHANYREAFASATHSEVRAVHDILVNVGLIGWFSAKSAGVAFARSQTCSLPQAASLECRKQEGKDVMTRKISRRTWLTGASAAVAAP